LSAPALEVRALVAGYVPELDILRGVSLEVREHEIVTVLNNSVWVVLSRDPAVVGRVINAPGAVGDWRPLMPRRDFTPWTDDFSTILPLIIAWNPAPENHQ